MKKGQDANWAPMNLAGSLCRSKPVAYGQGASFNKLLPFETDTVSTGVDACVRVKVCKV